MKTIVNKTRRPLRIKLSQGRVLHLGPSKEGRIGAQDAERETVRRLIEASEVELFDDASAGGSRGSRGAAGPVHAAGPHRQFSGSKRGDR